MLLVGDENWVMRDWVFGCLTDFERIAPNSGAINLDRPCGHSPPAFAAQLDSGWLHMIFPFYRHLASSSIRNHPRTSASGGIQNIDVARASISSPVPTTTRSLTGTNSAYPSFFRKPMRGVRESPRSVAIRTASAKVGSSGARAS